MTDLPPMSSTTTPKPRVTGLGEAESYISGEPAKVAGYFQTHVKATAIGAAVAGALVMLGVVLIFHI